MIQCLNIFNKVAFDKTKMQTLTFCVSPNISVIKNSMRSNTYEGSDGTSLDYT